MPPPPQPTGKVTPVLMPQAGQSMEEGTLVKWRVAAGDRIAKGDIIFEIETDKATMEVEATDSGRLSRIVLPEGGTLKVLEPVAYLAEGDADVDAYLAAAGGAAPGGNEPSEAAPTAKTVKASPAARRIAAERGVDLPTVGAGSGPQGRIVSTDLPAKGSTPSAPVAAAGVTRRRMSKMRKAIARNLLLSKQTIPHFYVKATVDADGFYGYYRRGKAKYPCSLNDVVVLACARVVAEFPAFRSRLDGEEIVEFPNANIGIAASIEDGLVVPVLMGAERLTLQQIAAEGRRIVAAARAGTIEGMGQGVFTITNLGMFGTEEFSAIINPPEAAILAVGAVREDVIVSDGAFKAGRVMTMTLSADHRVIDGALAAQFMARLAETLQNLDQLP